MEGRAMLYTCYFTVFADFLAMHTKTRDTFTNTQLPNGDRASAEAHMIGQRILFELDEVFILFQFYLL
jgi:hypothetical protein